MSHYAFGYAIGFTLGLILGYLRGQRTMGRAILETIREAVAYGPDAPDITHYKAAVLDGLELYLRKYE